MIEASLPDGTILEFPDGTNDAVIQNAVKLQLGISKPAAPVGEDQSELASRVQGALDKVPGSKSLTEFAAGVNRSVFGALDFLGPDNINAILNISGSDEQIPTFTESFGAKQGEFVGGLPGRIFGGAGEVAGMAAGTGAAIRGAAGQLPALGAAAESAGAGLLRQLGMTTAKVDVAGGLAAGAGQEVGRELDGERGALIGGIVSPSIVAVPLQTARSIAKGLLKKSAPSVDTLKDTARGIYKALDDSGVSVSDKSFASLSDDIASTLKKEGLDIDLTPKANAVVRRLQDEVGGAKTLTQLDTLRKVARGAAESIDKSESRLGVIAVNKIDEFLDGIGAEITQGQEAGKAFRSARDLWQRARKTELLEQALVNAENQASGFENGIRTQFRQILKRIDSGKQKGFTNEEREAIKKVVQGTNATNIAKFVGKFGVLDGVTSRSLTTLGGAGLAGAAGGAGAAAAVPLVGQISGALAQRMTLNNAKMAQSIIKAGKSGAEIARVYAKNTLKSDRNPAELAELFIKNQVPVGKITAKNAPRLVSDAAIIASIARLNDQKETE